MGSALLNPFILIYQRDLLTYEIKFIDLYSCPIEIINILNDEGQLQYLTCILPVLKTVSFTEIKINNLSENTLTFHETILLPL